MVAEWWDFWARLRKAKVIPTADVQIESEASGWTNDLAEPRIDAIEDTGSRESGPPAA